MAVTFLDPPRTAEGITFAQQYDSFRDPGRNPLKDLHKALDLAVLEVYGFDPNDDILAQLLALNLSTAVEEDAGLTGPRGPGARGFPSAYVDHSTISAEGVTD